MSDDEYSGGRSADLPPIEWPGGSGTDDASVAATGSSEAPPAWAQALRYQLLGLLVLVAAGFVAVSTIGLVSAVAETAAMVGVALGLVGFYSWPHSASNNS